MFGPGDDNEVNKPVRVKSAPSAQQWAAERQHRRLAGLDAPIIHDRTPR